MMDQGYHRSGLPTTTILPPLQRNRDYQTGRAYFDQTPQANTPILPSQMTKEEDRFGSVAGPTAYDPGFANTPPQ